jgi:hypothetical protein
VELYTRWAHPPAQHLGDVPDGPSRAEPSSSPTWNSNIGETNSTSCLWSNNCHLGHVATAAPKTSSNPRRGSPAPVVAGCGWANRPLVPAAHAAADAGGWANRPLAPAVAAAAAAAAVWQAAAATQVAGRAATSSSRRRPGHGPPGRDGQASWPRHAPRTWTSEVSVVQMKRPAVANGSAEDKKAVHAPFAPAAATAAELARWAKRPSKMQRVPRASAPTRVPCDRCHRHPKIQETKKTRGSPASSHHYYGAAKQQYALKSCREQALTRLYS